MQAELARFDGSPDDVEIFFSAHGVPESYVEQAGDPYKEEMEQCIGFIISELRVCHPSPALTTDIDPEPDRALLCAVAPTCDLLTNTTA